jgi:hypothetical protein
VNTLSRIRPLAWLCVAAAVISVAVAIAYFAAGHAKHGTAFLGLAVVAGIGVWFATAPRKAGSPIEANARD